MSSARLQVAIDRDACQGSRTCTRRAPRTFAMDAERKATVVDPAGDPEDAILAAANACPNFAIALESPA